MAVALEGVGLLGIALFMFLLAFLYATKWTIQPIIAVLHGALGWVPFVGNLVDRADRAIIGALNSAIKGVDKGIVILWHGVEWSFNESLLGLEYFTLKVRDAFKFAHDTVIPSIARAIVAPLVRTVTGLETRVANLVTREAKDVAKVEAEITSATAAVLATMTRRLRTVEAGLLNDINVAERAAEKAGRDALAVVKTAEDAAIGRAAALGTQALTNLEALGAVAAEEALSLPGLALDDLERLAKGIDWRKLAGTVGAVPLIYALVQALEAETGLGNRECRNKVKAICTTDPSKWLSFIEGLIAAGFVFNFRELVEVATDVAREAKPMLDRLAA